MTTKNYWPNQNDPTSVRVGVSASGSNIQIPPCLRAHVGDRAILTFEDKGVYIMPAGEGEGVRIDWSQEGNKTRGFGHLMVNGDFADHSGGLFRIVSVRTLTFDNMPGVYCAWPPEEHRSPICAKERSSTWTQAEALELFVEQTNHMTAYEVAEEIGKNWDVWSKVFSKFKGYVCPDDLRQSAAASYQKKTAA